MGFSSSERGQFEGRTGPATSTAAVPASNAILKSSPQQHRAPTGSRTFTHHRQKSVNNNGRTSWNTGSVPLSRGLTVFLFLISGSRSVPPAKTHQNVRVHQLHTVY